MENCVDIEKFGASELVVLKEPGSVRHPHGAAITKIMMKREDALELARQIQAKLQHDSEELNDGA